VGFADYVFCRRIGGIKKDSILWNYPQGMDGSYYFRDVDNLGKKYHNSAFGHTYIEESKRVHPRNS